MEALNERNWLHFFIFHRCYCDADVISIDKWIN